MYRLRKHHCMLSGNTATGRDSGFSLMEVIVSLIVAAILGTLLLQLMGVNLSGSAKSVVNAQQGFQLREVMEQITRDYRAWRKSSPQQAISVFENQVKTHPNYAGYIVSGQTGSGIEIDPGNDGEIEILKVTISDGIQTLVAFFTK